MHSPEPGRLAGYLRTVIEALPSPPPCYCVIGALAVNAWGRIRTTQDIDLLVLSQESIRAAVTGSLISHGFQPDETWIEHNSMAKDRLLRLGHPSSPGIPLDVLFSANLQKESALARGRMLNLIGMSVSVCSAAEPRG